MPAAPRMAGMAVAMAPLSEAAELALLAALLALLEALLADLEALLEALLMLLETLLEAELAQEEAEEEADEAADEAADHAARAADRSRLWTALGAPGPQPDPSDTAPVVDAALAHVARTPCGLAIFPLEDLIGLVEQPNLPGTTDEHPNWRRRMPDTTDALLARPEIAGRIALIETARES